MKKSSISKSILVALLVIFSLASCNKERVDQDDPILGQDPIAAKWFLKQVNDVSVGQVACYNESYIESDSKQITFFLNDILDNGDCKTVLNNTLDLTIADGRYYLGDEALQISINGNTLTWIIDVETSMVYEKN